jgi:hypothetical protein
MIINVASCINNCNKILLLYISAILFVNNNANAINPAIGKPNPVEPTAATARLPTDPIVETVSNLATVS